MNEPDYSEALAVVKAHMLARLGLEVREFFTPDELVAKWIEPGFTEGKDADEIAEAIAVHFHYKYDLEWLPTRTPSNAR